MATSRRRLTLTSSALAPSGSRVEKPGSPLAKLIPPLLHQSQRRIEEARLDHQQMNVLEYPEGAEEGLGELQIPDANSKLVQKEMSELAQQVMHIGQACNEEKELLENEFELVRANITFLETIIQTNQQRVDVEVSRVGSQMQLQ